jgi:hypothetical protein
MALKLKNNHSMVQYWKQDITNAINREEKDVIVNLASNEYASTIQKNHLIAKFISIQFKDAKRDKYKVVGIYAKQARGEMVHYIVKNNIESLDSIKNFGQNGYKYNVSLSSDSDWIFTRD